MAQQRFHCEQAFEDYLRVKGIPYIAVNETRKALLLAERRASHLQKSGMEESINNDISASHINLSKPDTRTNSVDTDSEKSLSALKSFDYLVTNPALKLLIDIKGRKYKSNANTLISSRDSTTNTGRLESWVTEDDVISLTHWQSLFGSEFSAVFIFMYWCNHQPRDLHFADIFTYRDRWYSMRMISVDTYKSAARPRSKRWRTVYIPSEIYKQISIPFTPPDLFPRK